MLEELSIRDFAIVDRLTVGFEPGLNLLTGETGAGKSILIGALSFLLGNRADTGIIRDGAEETLVSGVLGVDGNSEAAAWMRERSIEPEGGTIIIRRGLKRNGRGTIHVQNVPVLRQELQDLGSALVEVHGQRDGHALLRVDRHRGLVDGFAGLDADVSEYSARYQELGRLRKSLAELDGSEAERLREAELLRFAVDEIDAAAPALGEDEALADEERRLSQHEKLFAAVEQAKEQLTGTEGALFHIRKARSQLEAAAAIDQRLSDASRRLDDAYYEFEDLGQAISTYAGETNYDPARLEYIESRLATLQKLKRKYGHGLAEVLEHRAGAADRLSRLEHRDEDRSGLEKAISALEADVKSRAESLSASRVASARKLDEGVRAILPALGMTHARFATRIERLPPVDGKTVVGPTGIDDIGFYVAANKGEPLRPLADVASGGELSRIMLALRTVLTGEGGANTMVFDEVDAGIGGEVAVGVGLHLAGLAESRQVLCITHLASIAARADNHLKVEKQVDGERTVTRVTQLSGDDRVREIARMLSGDSGSAASLNHAAELLSRLRAPRRE